jgi:ubiquinone/menaquinone biosynthesis C-methylase UbiE
MNDKQDYPLGYSEVEDKRLALQARVLDPLTDEVLRHAGIRKGMKVLDVGCGVGDVSLLAARLVGPDGTVVGVDRSVTSLEIARQRARSAGVANVQFVEAEIPKIETGDIYDAIVGRLVLLYFKDRAATIQNLLAYLGPGGIVAFHEMDMSSLRSPNPTKLVNRVSNWIVDAFAFAGIETDMGPKFPAVFLAAGLPRPEMIAGQRVDSGPDSLAYTYLAATVRSLLPVIERGNIATTDEVGIDTLAERLRDEAISGGLVNYLPRMVGAWARVP